MKIDSENIDVLQTLANLRVIRGRDAEANGYLRKVVKIMLQDPTNLPSIEFRMVTSRLMVELQEWKDAIKVLDTVI